MNTEYWILSLFKSLAHFILFLFLGISSLFFACWRCSQFYLSHISFSLYAFGPLPSPASQFQINENFLICASSIQLQNYANQQHSNDQRKVNINYYRVVYYIRWIKASHTYTYAKCYEWIKCECVIENQCVVFKCVYVCVPYQLNQMNGKAFHFYKYNYWNNLNHVTVTAKSISCLLMIMMIACWRVSASCS